MIPWQLKFHGIRDYEPTVMDLSGQGEHVLIAGPNGSGKSTITFCMGAVLYSAKVELEGLKSKNINEGEPWQASIRFLFKNEGPSRIDGPLYVAFTLDIDQDEYGSTKRTYKISTGDEENDLTHETVYRSGGQLNFGDYRTVLTDKYKIYPDDYYLIWYQQEVNQFSTMSPEERFRVFSDMHGISNIQHHWEASMTQVKEAEAFVQEAEAAVSNDKMNLGQAKRMYDRLLSHQKIIHDNGKRLIQSLTALTVLYEKELRTIHKRQEDLVVEEEDLAQTLAQIDSRNTLGNETLYAILQEKRIAETAYIEKENRRKEQSERVKKLKETIDQLDEVLKELAEKSRRLRYSEEQTKKLADTKQNRLAILSIQKEKLENRDDVLDKQNQEVLIKQANLNNSIQEFEKQALKNEELLQQYVSHHHVQSRINFLTEEIGNADKKIQDIKENIMVANEELSALKRNHIVSKRQQYVLDNMKRAGVKAFPLRTLVELQDGAPLTSEQRLDSIKYTIFYDAKEFAAVNDLYHVSLRNIVPQSFMETIPELHLRMKKGLREEEKSFAAKAIWWIRQFLVDEPRLEGNQLVDVRGIRGNQENHTYILSESALQSRAVALKKLLHSKEEELQLVTAKYDAHIKERGDLYRVSDKVAEAEAFNLQKAKNAHEMKMLSECVAQLVAIQQEKVELKEADELLVKESSRLVVDLEDLQIELDIYRQLGEQKQQFEKLQMTKEEHKTESTNMKILRTELDALDDEFYQIESKEKGQIRLLNELAQQKIDCTNEQQVTKRMKEDTNEQEEILKEKLVERTIELDNVKEDNPKLFQETSTEEPYQNLSEVKLNEIYFQSNGAYQLERQQTDVNAEAENIYKKAKENYEQRSTELEKFKVLLEENKLRAEENEQRLLTSIQMKTLRIQQLFQNYMNHFQFEAEVSVDRYETKNRRVLFRLFIKVRRQGHRGKLEDVGIKARAGKVGKGVSGGEESLSSLLFALALLQELDIRPSFIILDEFDSALDEGRKAKVFDLYAEQLERKLIIVSPKGHENNYLNHFGKAYIARHDALSLQTILAGVRKNY